MNSYASPNGKKLPYPRPRMDIITRSDGRIEKICKHGVGHPIGHVSHWEDWMGVHGCDGCCGKDS